MRKNRLAILIILFSVMTHFCFVNKSYAEMPAKAKAFLIVSGYGTAGGALLGLATMAFGKEARAVFQGASLGLYTGMLFGGYVVLAHKYRNSRPAPGTYNDPITPYSPDAPSDSPYGGGFDGGGFFDSPTPDQAQRVMQAEDDYFNMKRMSSILKEKEGNEIPLYINLIKLNF